MREILFRGKRTYNDKWVEGFYVCLHDQKGNASHRIYNGYAESDCGDFYPDWWEVDPKTIGQYTGLCDKNSKKIFEGDVVCYEDDGEEPRCFQVKFGEYSVGHIGFYTDWREGRMTKYFRKDLGFWVTHTKIEIIGNIHDDPELLEVGNG